MLLKKINNLLREIRRAKYDNAETRLLVGALLAKNVESAKSLKDSEFKVFSQYGDDGIIQYLINKMPSIKEVFVEFGVETYEEANTRFLLLNNNWKGLIIDGSEKNIDYVKKDPIYWRQDLTAVKSFITAENINGILRDNGITGEIGLLSIDIDGNDYWVWKAIDVIDAAIVVIEFNSVFGNEREITTPYKIDFYRTDAHYSNLYFGASLSALYSLGKSKGYSFLGCNQAGNNAYFVKSNLLGNLSEVSILEGYTKSKFRESRNSNGDLDYLDEESRRRVIAGMPVVNTKTGLIESL